MTNSLLGVTLVANGLELGYPFEACIRNLSKCCNKVLVSTDTNNRDNTKEELEKIKDDCKNIEIIETSWDWSINNGSDLANQINNLIEIGRMSGCGSVLYVQADEVVDCGEINELKNSMGKDFYDFNISIERTYFWGDLNHINLTWTHSLFRLVPITTHTKVVGDGMFMEFDKNLPCTIVPADVARIYHYSRVGDTKKIAERLNNLDSLFHKKEDFNKLSDYELGKNNNYEQGADGALVVDYSGKHPQGII